MKLLGAFVLASLTLVACSDDGDHSSGDDTVSGGARDFTVRIENVASWTVLKAGTQATKTGQVDGPLGPNEAFQVRFTAAPGQSISFAAMLRESNDWFFAPGPDGIPLYQDGVAVSGDVTQFVKLWDAGTEADQEPFVGDATGVKQLMRNQGDPDPNNIVREVPPMVQLTSGATFNLPAMQRMIRVTLTPGADQQFTLLIEDTSRDNTLQTSDRMTAVHIAPIAWTLHEQPAPFFEPGEPARPNGLELLAEAGQPDTLAATLRTQRGFATPLSPTVVVVGTTPNLLFTPGEADRGLGLERLAEDGDPKPLVDSLNATPPEGVVSATEVTAPVDSDIAGAAAPGQAFEVVVHGEPGQFLTFASMFEMSNDWFFSTSPEGIALYEGDIPRTGNVTTEVFLYDLGTEGDEELDVGPDTGVQQAAPNTGRPDRVAQVRGVTVDRYSVQPLQHIRVTLRPH
ncbi:MAG: hypothetical protein HOV81_33835 [Kofleriaceae bacterium]|nr:hypothetical protein [Kofleriaceae bacterium]